MGDVVLRPNGSALRQIFELGVVIGHFLHHDPCSKVHFYLPKQAPTWRLLQLPERQHDNIDLTTVVRMRATTDQHLEAIYRRSMRGWPCSGRGDSWHTAATTSPSSACLCSSPAARSHLCTAGRGPQTGGRSARRRQPASCRRHPDSSSLRRCCLRWN